MKAHRMKKAAAIGLAVTAAVAITGCGQGKPSEKAAPDAKNPVSIEYWGWASGVKTLVDEWNANHPEIQVKFSDLGTGSSEALAKISSAVQAGNAPCLTQADTKWITSMASSNLMQDISKEAAPYKAAFPDGAWNSVTLGGTTYGLPQDTGPVVMYYNKTQFEALGLTVPTTWADFATTAASVHAAHPDVRLSTFRPDDSEAFQSYVQQAGGQWWSIKDNSWIVDATGQKSMKVADYWQGLIDQDLVSTTKRWDTNFYTELLDGKVLTVIGAAWEAPLLADNLTSMSGDWAVAALPAWEAGSTASANQGGSATVVLKGCEQVDATLQFANWLNTNADGLLGIGLYPAVTADISTPETLKPFFGGQDFYTVLQDASKNVETQWLFAPNYTAMTIGDMLASVANGKLTLPKMLEQIQDESLTTLTAAGLSAKAAG